MTVYVWRDGVLVDKASLKSVSRETSAFPTPAVSHMDPYASPIDGHEVRSWRQRDAELKANDAYDPRDFTGTYSKGRQGVKDNG